MKIGIISGHKIPKFADKTEELIIDTIYGDVKINVSKINHNKIIFLNRHGIHEDIPPHKINYLANIEALSSCKVDAIFSVGTVGSMDSTIKPGEVVIPHDFCDFTKNRTSTFFDEKRIHVDMTKPFCSSLRELLIYSCEEIEDIYYHKKGIYITTEGPRLETQTEINFYSKIGNIIGMTLSPEIILSKEKGICFASVCLVCNMAAGLQARLTAKEISYIY